MSKTPVAIFGAGGLGRELKSWIEKLDEYTVIGFFDDHVAADSLIDGLRVLGNLNDLENFGAVKLVIAIGSPEARAELIPRLTAMANVSFPTLIHPRAIIDDAHSVRLGKGTVITAGCVLTTKIILGDHVLVNLNATIGHDCVIGQGSCIMPGVHLSGQVTIGDYVLLGTGACVLTNISVGSHAKVGAGAVVTRAVPAGSTAVGIPANPIKR